MWPGDILLDGHQPPVHLGFDHRLLRGDCGDAHGAVSALLRGRRVQLHEHRHLLVYHPALRRHPARARARREVLLRRHAPDAHRQSNCSSSTGVNIGRGGGHGRGLDWVRIT